MMKFLAIGLLALPALASAQMTPAPATTAPAGAAPQADQRPGAPLDPVNFCYFDGKAFSKGARHMDHVCSAGGLVSYTAAANRPAQTLSWVPVPKR